MASRPESPSSIPLLLTDDDCPLPAATQRWNICCFAGIWCLYYLAAPVSYIGITHANLLKSLGQTTIAANLPSALYLATSVFPVLIAWFLPHPKLLTPLLVAALSVEASATAALAALLWLRPPSEFVSAGVIAHGAIFGAAGGVVLTTMWELVRRGVSTSRRGYALGLSFGIGPLLACVGSLGQLALFSKITIGRFSFGHPYPFPTNYLLLFVAAVPILLGCSALAASFVVPRATQEPSGAFGLAEITGGLRQFFTYRPLVFGAVAYLLVYSGGNAIMQNASIYAKVVLESGTDTQGIQQFLRFGCKAVTGACLGWLLAKTNPKAALLATTSILLLAMTWTLNSHGWWYLASFGIFGSGELFGAYFPNYVATASAKSRVRLNIAYLSLLGSLVGVASYLYGWIADKFGLVASFHAAAGVLVLAMGWIIVALPTRPVPIATSEE
ncbi:MAG TPA: hypothetical protein VND64_31675 [Pirellulales bacterium]|nr:hypothetical protein [Pirellulales bacterium]